MTETESETDDDEAAVGYRRPPAPTRFRKGVSGNPRGRPPNGRKSLPYDTVLGHLVTIREDGRERRVTAAEAFLLHLTRKGLRGDNAAARASLAAIETARASRAPADRIDTLRIVLRGFGVGGVLEILGMATKTNPLDSEKVRYWLKPWIVQAALQRLGSRQLGEAEQREVWGVTMTPGKVNWPQWWTERRPPETPQVGRKRPSDSDL